jgi:E3 ubiquitin-protein ligase MUL1
MFYTLTCSFLKVGLLDEEKILPSGKDITAVGMFSFKNGIPEIKSCKDLPYFL